MTLVQRRMVLPPGPASAALARSCASAACCDWRIPHRAADLGAVTRELVRNAVQHAGSAPRITISLYPDEVVVGVRDGLRCAPPRPSLSSADEPGGWGLWIVTALASRWGVHAHDDGKTVWAALSTAEVTPALTTVGSGRVRLRG